MRTTELEALADANGRCADPSRIRAVAAGFGLSPASPAQIAGGHALAERLISKNIASSQLLASVQAITESSLFVYSEDGQVTGVLGFFPVDAAGLAALEEGGFDAREFDLALVCRPGESPQAIYAFGVAAATKAAGSAVIRGSAAIQEGLFWALPIFTRVATEDGARVLLGGLGFSRMANDPTLVRRAPRAAPLEGYRAGAAA